MPKSPSQALRAANPQMNDDFARVYDLWASRITDQVSVAALDAVGGIEKGTRILDIAAGTGALSVPAAKRGAAVTAVDVAPGMVKRLATKLMNMPGCEALVMDGEALELPDGGFDATFSIFGVITFSDWRKGLTEQARTTRPGGAGAVASWLGSSSDSPASGWGPPGAAPFKILFAALHEVFPDRPAPPWSEGFTMLGNSSSLRDEMMKAGFADVVVQQVVAEWEGPVGQAYLDEVRELHQYIRPYKELDEGHRAKVDEAIIRITERQAISGRIYTKSPALIAVGKRS